MQQLALPPRTPSPPPVGQSLDARPIGMTLPGSGGEATRGSVPAGQSDLSVGERRLSARLSPREDPPRGRGAPVIGGKGDGIRRRTSSSALP